MATLTYSISANDVLHTGANTSAYFGSIIVRKNLLNVSATTVSKYGANNVNKFLTISIDPLNDPTIINPGSSYIIF